MLKYLTSIVAATVLVATACASSAAPIGPKPDLSSMTIEVSGGCGPHGWRGPWGHCRDTPYYGRLPNGSYKTPGASNGCPPGSWRGPYDHCRNTPFHGRLPNGSWA